MGPNGATRPAKTVFRMERDYGLTQSPSQGDPALSSGIGTETLRVVSPPATSDQREGPQTVAVSRFENAGTDQSRSPEYTDGRLVDLPSGPHDNVPKEQLAQAIEIVNRIHGVHRNGGLYAASCDVA